MNLLTSGPITFNRINFSPVNTSLVITPQLKDFIDSFWTAEVSNARAKNKEIYDSPNYRFEGLREEIDGSVTILVSQIMYSERLALRALLKKDTENESLWSGGMGVGGLMTTTDNYVLLGRKSGKTNAKNPLGFVGGLLTYSEVSLVHGQDLMRHLFTEILEETGISSPQIADSKLVGIVRAKTGGVMFLTETTLTLNLAEVNEIFKDRPSSELAELVALGKDELKIELDKLGDYYQIAGELFLKLPEFNNEPNTL